MTGLRYSVCGAAGRGGGDVGRPGGGFDGGASTAGETYLVTTTADTNDGRCDAQCSVREAILAANAHPGADTVRIPAGVYTLTIQGVNESAGATGDLDITGPVDVVGAGQGHTIFGRRPDRPGAVGVGRRPDEGFRSDRSAPVWPRCVAAAEAGFTWGALRWRSAT